MTRNELARRLEAYDELEAAARRATRRGRPLDLRRWARAIGQALEAGLNLDDVAYAERRGVAS